MTRPKGGYTPERRERMREYHRQYLSTYRWAKAMRAAAWARKKAIRFGFVGEHPDWTVFARLHYLPCAYCGKSPALHADHVVPLAAGGQNTVGNLAPSCRSCNESKGCRTPEEWRARKPRSRRAA